MDVTQSHDENVKIVIDIATKLGVLGVVLFVSFLIIKPFLALLVWSIILAVALFPMVESLGKKLNMSRKKTVIILTILANLALVVPTYMLSEHAIDSMVELKEIASQDSFSIPAPKEHVKEWPIIGKKAYSLWYEASHDFESLISSFSSDIKLIISNIAKALGDTLSVILMSMASLIIAAFLIIGAEKYARFYKKISTRLIGAKGDEWAVLTALTIRSVATGVIGVAAIQAVFAFIGLMLMKVPFAIVLTLGIMFLTIIQIPAILIIGPVIAYVLSGDTSVGAIIFTIYMLIVGSSDGVLKPLLMGRGVDIPMLVVLIGAIGGMILMGMIGLFVGAVIFALAYKLFMLWVDDMNDTQEVS